MAYKDFETWKVSEKMIKDTEDREKVEVRKGGGGRGRGRKRESGSKGGGKKEQGGESGTEALDILEFWSSQERSTRYSGILEGERA